MSIRKKATPKKDVDPAEAHLLGVLHAMEIDLDDDKFTTMLRKHPWKQDALEKELARLMSGWRTTTALRNVYKFDVANECVHRLLTPTHPNIRVPEVDFTDNLADSATLKKWATTDEEKKLSDPALLYRLFEQGTVKRREDMTAPCEVKDAFYADAKSEQCYPLSSNKGKELLGRYVIVRSLKSKVFSQGAQKECETLWKNRVKALEILEATEDTSGGGGDDDADKKPKKSKEVTKKAVKKEAKKPKKAKKETKKESKKKDRKKKKDKKKESSSEEEEEESDDDEDSEESEDETTSEEDESDEEEEEESEKEEKKKKKSPKKTVKKAPPAEKAKATPEKKATNTKRVADEQPPEPSVKKVKLNIESSVAKKPLDVGGTIIATTTDTVESMDVVTPVTTVVTHAPPPSVATKDEEKIAAPVTQSVTKSPPPPKKTEREVTPKSSIISPPKKDVVVVATSKSATPQPPSREAVRQQVKLKCAELNSWYDAELERINAMPGHS